MKDSIKIFAPATISNVGPGFDLMGFAIEQPGDILIIRKNNKGEIRLTNNTDACIPMDPDKNVSVVAARALLDELHIRQGFDISFEQKINPGSGIGSSAASCTAAVFGINELLGRPLKLIELIPSAMKGEFLASGSVHADNIAPALLGGFILIRDYHPIDIVRLNAPDSLFCVVVHPDIFIKTSESRKLIPTEISLSATLQQCGNIAGLVAGISTSDYNLIGRSLNDVLAEPVRAPLIPGFYALKEKVLNAGALGSSISGSGPSIFAFCTEKETATKISVIMSASFTEQNITNRVYVSKISSLGTCVIE